MHKIQKRSVGILACFLTEVLEQLLKRHLKNNLLKEINCWFSQIKGTMKINYITRFINGLIIKIMQHQTRLVCYKKYKSNTCVEFCKQGYFSITLTTEYVSMNEHLSPIVFSILMTMPAMSCSTLFAPFFSHDTCSAMLISSSRATTLVSMFS